jgi:hypothetical protein
VDLDEKKLEYYFNRPRGAGWGKSQPNNAFLSLPRSVRMPLFVTQKREGIWKTREDVKAHLSCNEAVDPIRRYEILRPARDLPDFQNRKSAKFEKLEERLRNSWQKADPVCFLVHHRSLKC